MKKALITGITGQDGSYLSELLLEKGYDVHGLVRRTSTFNRERIDHLYNPDKGARKIRLHYGDLSDAASIIKIVQDVGPDEIYNLAAQSHVGISFTIPEYTMDINHLGTLRVLQAITLCGLEKKTRFYQASSSEIFGDVKEVPQKETTPFNPVSPYGRSKAYAFDTTASKRKEEGVFAVNGILFNHESPRRGENFVTRKITKGLAEIIAGKQDKLYLGNLDAKRDWGYAKEYVEAMWLMLQQPKADDYIIATGETHSVREFLEEACKCAGMEVESNHETGVNEKYLDKRTGKVIAEVDPEYFRPSEVNFLVGDASKAKRGLGWEPKTKFKELVRIMVEADIKAAIKKN